MKAVSVIAAAAAAAASLAHVAARTDIPMRVRVAGRADRGGVGMSTYTHAWMVTRTRLLAHGCRCLGSWWGCFWDTGVMMMMRMRSKRSLAPSPHDQHIVPPRSTPPSLPVVVGGGGRRVSVPLLSLLQVHGPRKICFGLLRSAACSRKARQPRLARLAPPGWADAAKEGGPASLCVWWRGASGWGRVRISIE
jgi:hypothetical protein